MPKVNVFITHNESTGREMEQIGEMEFASVPAIGEYIRHQYKGEIVLSKVNTIHHSDGNKVDAYISDAFTQPLESFYQQYGALPAEEQGDRPEGGYPVTGGGRPKSKNSY